jgi:hypothetical protein
MKVLKWKTAQASHVSNGKLPYTGTVLPYLAQDAPVISNGFILFSDY